MPIQRVIWPLDTPASLRAALDKFASEVQRYAGVIESVDTLPATDNFTGRTLLNNADNQAYMWTNGSWIQLVDLTFLGVKVLDATMEGVAAAKITGQLSASQISGIEAAQLTTQITSTQIADDAITTPKIAAGAVTANEIYANTITSNQIAAYTITGNEIQGGTITGAKIAAGAISAVEIAAATITGGNIAGSTITAGNIVGNTITAAQIDTAYAYVGSLNANQVTVGTLGASVIYAGTLAANLVTAGTLNSGVLNTGTMNANLITAGTLGASVIYVGTLAANLILAGTMNSGVLNTGTMDASLITAGTLGAVVISAGTVNANVITTGTMSAARITAGTMSASRIYGNTLGACLINAGTVDAGVILAGTMLADRLYSGTIRSNVLFAGTMAATSVFAGTLTAGHIAAGAIGADEIAANVIAVKHLVVGDFSNIVTNHLLKDGDSTHWELQGGRASVVEKATSGVPASALNKYVFKIGYASYFSESGYAGTPTADFHPCLPGESYFVSAMWGSDATAGKGTLYIGIGWSDKDGTDIANNYLSARTGNSQPWTKHGGIVTAPANAAQMRMLMVHDTGSAGYYYTSNPVIRRAGDGELIVDGAITADKVGANEIIAQTANLKNLVVQNAKIDDNAVTVSVSAYDGSGSTVSEQETSRQAVISASITTHGQPVFINFTCSAMTSTGSFLYVYFFRGSTMLNGSFTLQSEAWTSSVVLPIGGGYVDQPSAGTYTYYVYMSVADSSKNVAVSSCNLTLMEVRK